MNLRDMRLPLTQRYALPVLGLLLVGSIIGSGIVTSLRERRLSDVAARGAQVMPFDLDRTTHMFEPLSSGGLQTVTSKVATDQEQIALIRQHLQDEADRFRKGDFSDPATIHGSDMPGLAALREGARKIDVRFDTLPDGGQLQYTTSDPALLQALHAWFQAQVSDHGQHAMPATQH